MGIIKRNQRREQTGQVDADRIHVPFLLVKTQSQTVINCEMAENRTEYYFDFNLPFEIHDDNALLQAMNFLNFQQQQQQPASTSTPAPASASAPRM